MTESRLGLVLWTTDITALGGFLTELANARLVEQHPGFARLDVGGADISLHADEADPNHPWYNALTDEGITRGVGAELRLRVDDVVAVHETAEIMGAVTVMDPYDAGLTRECQVMGPDGFLFTFWQPADPSLPPIAIVPVKRSAFSRIPHSRATVVRRR